MLELKYPQPQITENITNSIVNTSTMPPQNLNVLSFTSKFASEHLSKRKLVIVFSIIENILQLNILLF